MTPFDHLQVDEIFRIVHEAVQNMPPQRKRIFEMSRNEGLKPAAIAARLSLSVSTVKNVLSASLKEIRGCLRSSGHILPFVATPLTFF